jgi:hypothetical protein
VPYEDAIPPSIPRDWGMTTFADPLLPQPRGQGRQAAERTVALLTP